MADLDIEGLDLASKKPLALGLIAERTFVNLDPSLPSNHELNSHKPVTTQPQFIHFGLKPKSISACSKSLFLCTLALAVMPIFSNVSMNFT